MRCWYSQGQSLLGVTALSVGLAGCAARHDDSLRLSQELGSARADAASQQARVAELESRLSRLEQRLGEAATARNSDERSISSRLDRLIELNARMLAAQALTPPEAAPPQAAPPQAAPQSQPAVNGKRIDSNGATEAPANSQEQQLRALVESMRGRPGRLHGGLTREQEDALRVLLRTERKLDDENPWPAAFY